MRPALALSLLLLACNTGSSGDAGSTTEAPSTAAAASTTGDPPSGRGCPLPGLYVECDGGGRTYCDEIDGALRFGPCLDAVDCDLSSSASCNGSCELIDGVPTYVPPDGGCATSSNQTDSA